MRLSRVLLSRYPGVYEKYFADLCRTLGAGGYEIQAIIDRNFAYRSYLRADAALKVVKIRARAWRPLAGGALKAALEEFQPDLVEAHGVPATRLAAAVCKKLRLPLAIRLYDEGGATGWRGPQYGGLGRSLSPPPCYLACNELQTRILQRHHAPVRRIHLVHDFHTPRRNTPRPASKVGECFYFTAMGRLVPHQGFHFLLQALRLLLDQKINVCLLLGGAGPEQNRLWRLAGRLRLQSHLIMMGRAVEPRALLECADAFVLPSLDEAFGLVLLEAMAAGVPVISTRLPGPMEILTPKLAWLVQPGDPVELFNAMRQAILLPQLRVQQARLALEHCRKNFHQEKLLPRLTDAYRRFVVPEAGREVDTVREAPGL